MFLIVDDEATSGTALQRLLQHSGHEALWVNGGRAALTQLGSWLPSLVILDVNMPAMDGIQVLAAIRRIDALGDVRVMMYSSDVQSIVRLAAKRLGAVGYLVKGKISPKALISRLCELGGMTDAEAR